MKTLKVIILTLLFASTATAQEKIILALGEKKALSANATSLWIENKSIIQATPENSSIMIKALNIGESLIRINGELKKIQVLYPTQKESFEQLKTLINKTIGLKVIINKGLLCVSGNLYQLDHWKKLAQAELDFHMQAQLSSSLQKEAQLFFDHLFKQEKLPNQNIIFSNNMEIRIHSKSIYKEKYENILKPFGIRIQLDDSSLEYAPTVKVQITVAEIRKDLNMQYGLKWPTGYSAKILGDGTKEFSDLVFDAKAVEAKGWGQILASPNIICRSGKEAEFLAGGEFPIKIINFKSQDIVWKKYGVLLKVKPLADATGRISLSIETEVSTLDDSRAVDGIPGILTNHVSSHFDLNKPKTIALSGLLKNENGQNHEGVPFLARIPILGALFSSKNFRENKTELIIFVRPTILENEEDSTEPSENSKHLGGS